MSWTISKKFRFSASHQIDSLHDGHPCKRLQGHNYTAEFIFKNRYLDEHGFVIDFRDTAKIQSTIDKDWDHRHLNDVIANTTSEWIAETFFSMWKTQFPSLVAVRVSETDSTWAEYRREDV